MRQICYRNGFENYTNIISTIKKLIQHTIKKLIQHIECPDRNDKNCDR